MDSGRFGADPGEPSGFDVVMTPAATDPAFRRRLLIEPREAIRDTFGVEVPAGLTLRFIEKDPDVELMLVLPDLIDPDAPLDETRLDGVAGGTDWPWFSGLSDD